jgi:hypothetical protein
MEVSSQLHASVGKDLPVTGYEVVGPRAGLGMSEKSLSLLRIELPIHHPSILVTVLTDIFQPYHKL